MGWFEEQLNQRRDKDNKNLAEAMDLLAGAVMGRRLSSVLNSEDLVRSALEEVLKYYHCRPKTEELPPELSTPEEQIEYQLSPFGIFFRRISLDTGWYRQAVGPMLGTLAADGRAVALIPGKFSGYSYHDPESGKRIRLNRRTEKLLDAEAICFYQPLPLKALTVRDLLVFMAKQFNASDFLLYFGMAGVVTLLGLLSPLFTKWLFGTVLDSGQLSVLLSLAAFMLCYSVSSLCLTAFQTLMNSRVTTKVNIAVQAAVMSRTINLPVGFFRKYAAGELMQRTTYLQSLCSMLLDSLGMTGLTSLFSLVYLGQIFAFAPALVGPSLAITLLTLGLTLSTTLVQVNITRKKMKQSAQVSGLTYATITGIQKIKLAGAEKRMFARWAKAYAGQAALEYNPPLFLKLSGTLNTAVSLLGTLLLYYLAVKSGVKVADYYAFNASYAMVSGAFMAFASVAVVIANIRPTLEMARPIMETMPELSEGKLPVRELKGGIELSSVSFRYEEGMPDVIDNLSLKIEPGEYLAIVGSTGCGKSTLLRLLLGFEKPQKGSIYYDRKDMNCLDLKSLRRCIGTVMQDGKLFQGDIYSNIVISAPQLTLNDAWRAAEIASVAEDIRAMPMKMHTIISEGQGGISGGQRQRLMIARAVAPRPKILMFDEATSALDNLTQKKVSEAIDALKCTRIVIAHRLSTIRHADRIVFLQNGRVAEEGTYEELIARNGLFAALVERQRLDVELE